MWWLYIIYSAQHLHNFTAHHWLDWLVGCRRFCGWSERSFKIQKIQIKSIAIIEFFGNEFLRMPKRNPKWVAPMPILIKFYIRYQWNHITPIENSGTKNIAIHLKFILFNQFAKFQFFVFFSLRAHFEFECTSMA